MLKSQEILLYLSFISKTTNRSIDAWREVFKGLLRIEKHPRSIV